VTLIALLKLSKRRKIVFGELTLDALPPMGPKYVASMVK
jgi:hypothetical protein